MPPAGSWTPVSMIGPSPTCSRDWPIAFRLLHPLFDFLMATWTRETGAAVTVGANDDEATRFERTPWYRMLRDHASEFRRRIEPGGSQEFPIFEELAASGATDYFAQLTRFG